MTFLHLATVDLCKKQQRAAEELTMIGFELCGTYLLDDSWDGHPTANPQQWLRCALKFAAHAAHPRIQAIHHRTGAVVGRNAGALAITGLRVVVRTFGDESG